MIPLISNPFHSSSLARAQPVVTVNNDRGQRNSLCAEEERETSLANNKPVFVTSDQLLALRNHRTLES